MLAIQTTLLIKLKKIQVWFILPVLLFFGCTFNPTLNSNKQFGGLFSFLSSYAVRQSVASILVSGTLQNEEGTPIANGSLQINYNLFNSISRAGVDTKATLDSSGYFSFNANLGSFTIRVFNSSGEDLGSFTMNLTSDSIPPTITSSNGKFKVTGLAVKPISSNPTNPTNPTNCNGSSLCGFITGAYSQSGKFFVFGSVSEANNNNTPVIYETSDGTTFTKYKIQLGDCVPSFSSSTSVECRITAVAYDGSSYFVMGVKNSCTPPNCTIQATYAGSGSSLGSISINTVSPPSTSNSSSMNYVFTNSKFHYLSYTNNGTSIYTITNGSTFSTFPLTFSGTNILQSSCSNLFIGEGGNPFCAFKYYYNGTSWTSTTTSISNNISGNNISLRGGYYTKNNYQIIVYDSTTLKSNLYQGSGSLLPGGTFSTDTNPRLSGSGNISPLVSTTDNIYGFLADITQGSQSSPSTLNSISVVKSTDGGAAYTSNSITLPTKLTYPMGLGTTSSSLFLAGYTNESSNITKSYLFRSSDGITWTTVTLP